MPTNFPTSVDNFTNPTANDSLNLPSHSTQHANANDAIEAIETYVLANPVGLVYLSTTTFTSAGIIDMPSVFNSTYRNYTFQIEYGPSTSLGLRMNLKSGASDITTATYYSQRIGGDSTTVTALRQNVGYFPFGGGATGTIANTFNLYSPNVAAVTNFEASPMYGYSTAIEFLGHVGQNTNATAYDGIRIFTSTGTVTGRISMYGWR
jgi:hypothetical protein